MRKSAGMNNLPNSLLPEGHPERGPPPASGSAQRTHWASRRPRASASVRGPRLKKLRRCGRRFFRAGNTDGCRPGARNLSGDVTKTSAALGLDGGPGAFRRKMCARFWASLRVEWRMKGWRYPRAESGRSQSLSVVRVIESLSGRASRGPPRCRRLSVLTSFMNEASTWRWTFKVRWKRSPRPGSRLIPKWHRSPRHPRR